MVIRVFWATTFPTGIHFHGQKSNPAESFDFAPGRVPASGAKKVRTREYED